MSPRPKSLTANIVRRGATQTAGDVAVALRIIADEIDDGYTSGILGDIVWELKETL
jgi:hypothetical protein